MVHLVLGAELLVLDPADALELLETTDARFAPGVEPREVQAVADAIQTRNTPAKLHVSEIANTKETEDPDDARWRAYMLRSRRPLYND
jgi:hypothetical protein